MRYLLLIFTLIILTQSMAQETLAAAVEISHVGAEIRLNGTEAWLGLSDGAVTAFGTGDLLRTNALGRAWLHFGENASLLLLPNSELRLDTYDNATLEISLQGTAIIQASAVQGLLIHLRTVDIVAVEGNAGLWASPLQPDIVTVAEGSTRIRTANEEIEIAAGQGFRDDAADELVADLTMPYSAARLVGVLDGCSGLVDTGELAGVRVRTGAGRGYQQRGLIDNGAEAILLGQTESSGWTRIQFASGFAWITSFSLQSDCDLPVLPNDAPEEDLTRVVNGDERELNLLYPYFGSPLFDGFFYGFED